MSARPLSLDAAVLRFAGVVVLASLALAHWLDPRWLWLTAFAGANMIQASFTGLCPAAMLLRRLGIAPGTAFE